MSRHRSPLRRAGTPTPNGSGTRAAKVHCLYRGEEPRPFLRLSGKWLEQAGFAIGARFVVEMAPGELRIRTLPGS